MINLSIKRDGDSDWEYIPVEAALIRLDPYDIEAVTITEQNHQIVLTRVGMGQTNVISRLIVEDP